MATKTTQAQKDSELRTVVLAILARRPITGLAKWSRCRYWMDVADFQRDTELVPGTVEDATRAALSTSDIADIADKHSLCKLAAPSESRVRRILKALEEEGEVHRIRRSRRRVYRLHTGQDRARALAADRRKARKAHVSTSLAVALGQDELRRDAEWRPGTVTLTLSEAERLHRRLLELEAAATKTQAQAPAPASTSTQLTLW